MPHISNRRPDAAADAADLRVLFLAYNDYPVGMPTRYKYLSAELSGTIIAPNDLPGTRDRSFEFGRFRYVEFRSLRRSTAFGALRDIREYIRIARTLVDSGETYNLIVASGLFKTAVAGLILKRLLSRPLIIELPIVLRKIVQFRSPRWRVLRRIPAFLYEGAAVAVLSGADHIKQIFPGQIEQVSRRLSRKACSAFPDFTPVHAIELSQKEDSLLLIGTPLHLKGADVAIRAFKRLLPEFAGERLLVIGSAVGFKDLALLIGPSDPIELVDYLPHREAIEYIRSAKIVLIPSRTDAMPRVAVEAMAAGKPIVASRVDGMAVYLEHRKTAMLCAPENHEDLAERIRELLLSPELRTRLGNNAREMAHREFSEQAYVRHYLDMVRRCAKGNRRSD
jgi:glycosyltransferase involved in cell wall biosynthesis